MTTKARGSDRKVVPTKDQPQETPRLDELSGRDQPEFPPYFDLEDVSRCGAWVSGPLELQPSVESRLLEVEQVSPLRDLLARGAVRRRSDERPAHRGPGGAPCLPEGRPINGRELPLSILDRCWSAPRECNATVTKIGNSDMKIAKHPGQAACDTHPRLGRWTLRTRIRTI